MSLPDWSRRAAAIVIALVLVGDIAALAVIEDDKPAPTRPRATARRAEGSATTVKHPKKWDPRIVDLAKFVEDERGLKFDHPVAVRFLPEAEYLKELGSGRDDLTKEDREEIELFAGQAHALGIIPKDVNPLDAIEQVIDEGTLAYYDPAADLMVVRGTELTVGLRTTVVHELTHALQDQNFDLEREFDTSGGESLFDALVEGDAVRIEDGYVLSLDDDEQEEHAKEDAEVRSGVDLEGVPPALVQLFGAPYALGPSMTTIVLEEKGQSALDEVFRKPPSSDEAILNPFALLDRDKPADVPVPKLRKGETETDEGDFGSLTWFVVLSTFIEPRTALVAVDGWKGDAYAGYKKDGRNCLRVDFRGDTAKDADEMKAALDQWQKAFASNRVTVVRNATGVVLDACEPDSIPAPRAGADEAIALPVVRMQLVSEIISGGAPVRVARCFAREFVTRVDVALLNESDAAQRMFERLGNEIRQVCR